MKSLVVAFVKQSTVGVVVICVGVPVLQSHVVPFATARESGSVLTVSGDVSDLQPGKPGRLVLTLTNKGDLPAPVHRITTAVRATAPGCSLTVDAWTGSLSVPAGGNASRAVAVQVTGSRCAGVQWDLFYTAS